LIIFLFFIAVFTGCTKKQKAAGPDTTPPVVQAVFAFDTTRVLVEFNEVIDSSSAADTLHYRIMSYETLAVHNVDIDPMKKRCVLMTAHQESTHYDITIEDIMDVSGNRLEDTVVTFLGIGMAVDSIAPTLTIYDPSSGDTMYGFEYFSVNASDNFWVKTVKFYLNDSLAGEDYDFPYYAIVDVRDLPEGSMASLWATAEDFAANVGFSDTLEVFIGYHPDFPYVVIDTIPTAVYPARMDVTADGSKVFFARLPSYPYTTTSCLMVIYTDTNMDEVMVSLDPPVPIYYLDVYGNDFVYFTHGTGFSVFDIGLEQVISTTDIGGAAQGIVRSSGDKLYISRRSTNEVLVYSLQTNAFVDSIPVPGEPTALAVDTLNSEVYVALYSQPLVAILDTQGDSLVDSVSLSGEAFEIQFSPDFSTAYISEIFDHSIGIVETATHSLIDEISPSGLTNPKGMAVTNDGEYLFVASMSNRVYVINTFDYSEEWTFSIGQSPYAATLTPSNDKLYVTCSVSFEVYCIGF
jgi:DNA-binding beta-propeller fold protein YncE